MEYYAKNTDSNYLQTVQKLVQSIADKLHLDDAGNSAAVAIPQDRGDNVVLPDFLRNKGSRATVKSIKEELVCFLQEQVLENVLMIPLYWWKVNAYRFQKLGEVVKAVLGVPATSAASERVFSRARLALPWNRCRLAPTTLQAIMCLREWLHVGNEDFEKALLDEFDCQELEEHDQ